MPWQEQSTMSLKQEFVTLADHEGANIGALCRRFGISRQTGYKWLRRYRIEGTAGLSERSRRPQTSPTRTAPEVEARLLAVRDAHPTWGGRKLRRRVLDQGAADAPAASTVTAILARHGRLDPAETAKHTAWERFEYPAPNDPWQMDFTGHVALADGRCHPLTVLDDHSRFLVGLTAGGDERDATVRAALTACFRRYGLPWRILTDNGPPWGCPQPTQDLTALGVWLLRLGVAVSHGRPRHPQTHGKAERFHRTLKADLLRDHADRDLADAQRAFDPWRDTDNLERPHDALDPATPASRYRASPRPFPEALPPIEYGPDDLVRKVKRNGQVSVRGHHYFLSLAPVGQPVGLRPTPTDGVLAVSFCQHAMGTLDLRRSPAEIIGAPTEEVAV